MVLNGCETWPLTLREERRLRMFENRVLWRIFGPKRHEVTREWRKLHNEWSVRLIQYCSGDKIEKSEMGGACNTCEGEERRMKGFGGETWGKETTSRCRWEDNIKMNLQEVGYGGMDWIELTQDRDRWWALVNAVINFRVPWNSGIFLTSWEPVSFSRRTHLHGVSK